ncbi:peptide chain release factor 1 [Clostridium sp. CAG:433]|jgi:peptide chain release factor 1|nr:peptide chain release factor 1 [Clostridium sp. CAG:433]HCJ32295.1 peptide chain release factor 1 [Bacillota bacterium]
MIDRLEATLEKYNSLTEELSKPEVLSDVKKMTSLSKEQASLADIIEKYKEYKKVVSDINDAKEMLDDKEMAAFAKEEISRLETEKENLEKELEVLLLPKDPNDDKNTIVEIRGAAGGDEANLFAGDLFEMYSRYAENMGWKIEIINAVEGTSGGYSQIEFMVKGENVYSKLKYESGTHRVQRVPSTESQGRVHTSTATVAVLPEVEDIDIEIKDSDIRVDVYRSSGAGGQGVNTTDSAVRITYLPTNTVVTCQNERSQLKNKEQAMKVLKSKIYEDLQKKQNAEIEDERRSKIGTGDRAEKIRTYNYPQNRVTDHRINLTIMQLDRIMQGKLDEIIEALINEDQRRKLAGE